MSAPAIAARGLTRVFEGLTAVHGVVGSGVSLFERSESAA